MEDEAEIPRANENSNSQETESVFVSSAITEFDAASVKMKKAAEKVSDKKSRSEEGESKPQEVRTKEAKLEVDQVVVKTTDRMFKIGEDVVGEGLVRELMLTKLKQLESTSDPLWAAYLAEEIVAEFEKIVADFQEMVLEAEKAQEYVQAQFQMQGYYQNQNTEMSQVVPIRTGTVVYQADDVMEDMPLVQPFKVDLDNEVDEVSQHMNQFRLILHGKIGLRFSEDVADTFSES